MMFKCFILKHQQALLVMMAFAMSFAGVEPHRDGNSNNKQQHSKSKNAYTSYDVFETMNNTIVTAQIGGTAILPCVVETSSLLATVTWIRRRDFQLLTVGLTTYSSDERFHVEHARHKGIWDLRIKAVRKDDEGTYECNLSNHPPESIFIKVLVVEAVAEINGASDIHIDEGSTLKLECKIRQATESPSFIFWYHEDKMVNFNDQDGYSVITTKLPTPSPLLLLDDNNEISDAQHTGDDDDNDNNEDNDDVVGVGDGVDVIERSSLLLPTATSVLFVHEVQFKHGGNYTCAPSNTRPTSIIVHVLKGDKPAAMKHSNQSASSSSTLVGDGKSSGRMPMHNLLYNVCSVLLVYLHISHS